MSAAGHPRPADGLADGLTGGLTGDEIAVVGLAARVPGAEDAAALWRLLLDGVDAVHDHTDDELRALGLPAALIADPALVRGHGRLGVPAADDDTGGAAGFDAELFGVPAADAARMDPQHRVFLEQAFAALQDAGLDPLTGPDGAVGPDGVTSGAAGPVVGVYAGCSPSRYLLFHLVGNPAVAPEHDREAQLVQGTAADYLPMHVAHRLGTTGPAIAVQTACSSSLTAVALAATGLLDHRCDVAIAGGVSVTQPRFRHTPGGIVSRDGRCRAFDAAGDGSGYGSGAAAVVLRRLDDALADGDTVHAVLRGWGVTNDGAARAGFAAPGLDGQADAIAEALASAELTGADVGYVEAHGSGTVLGDAIEVAALTRAYGPDADCLLGTLRANLGNLDAASGVVGLVKAVLAVRDGVVPATLHHDTPNPQIDFGGFTVATKTADWPRAGVRRAGVSSFGLGGTNAHVVVEQPPAPAPRPGAPEPGPVVLPLSARTPAALAASARALAGHLAAAPAGDPWLLADVARTLAGRRVFACRAAVVADPAADDAVAAAVTALRGVAADPARPPSGPAGGPAAAAAQAWAEAGERVPTVPGARRTWLPPYPFERTRHWIEAPR